MIKLLTNQTINHSSFSVIHKVGNVGIFELLIFRNNNNNNNNNKDREISHFNINSKHLDKCQFTLKLILFSVVSNLFPLEVMQKCLCCQLCVLWEHSIVLSHQEYYVENQQGHLDALSSTPESAGSLLRS